MKRALLSAVLLFATASASGTVLPAYLVEDVYPGMSGAQFNSGMDSRFAVLDGNAVFWGYDSFNGVAGNLWHSDSTAAGTDLVKATSNSSADPPNLFGAVSNGRVFYVYDDGVHGIQLWTSNGVAGGTLPLTSFATTDFTSFGGLLPVGDLLYFVGADPGNGASRLRRSDGSIVGTTIVNPTLSVSLDKTLVEARGLIFFAGYDSAQLKGGLMKSDGTPGGTSLIKEFASATYVHVRTAVNDLLVFTVVDANNNSVLWTSDGTTAGTTVLIDTDPEINSSIGATVRVDDRLFFVAEDQMHGRELWATGPGLTSPALVKDIHNGLIDSGILYLTAMNGLAYFIADDGINGKQLWRSDGTEAGTNVVKDLDPEGVDFPSTGSIMLDQIGRHLVTKATGGIWVSDGTAGGTRKLVQYLNALYHVFPVQGQAWFAGNAGPETGVQAGTEPYAFDALANLGPSWCVKPELSIPDNSSVSARTRLKQTTTIANLNVILDIGHTWVGDLVVKLVHEDTGTSVTLLDRPVAVGTGLNCSGKLVDVTLDDFASTPADTQCLAATRPAYPRDRHYRPITPLSAFNGQSLAGTWRLDLQDAFGSDVGTLHEWCMVVNDLIFANGHEVP